MLSALLEHTTSMTYSVVTSSHLHDFRIQMHLIETIASQKAKAKILEEVGCTDAKAGQSKCKKEKNCSGDQENA